tara:strand:+ start:744 stop:1250 length:507 start_codon:yes stop_codon:yes gene_type:complete
MIRYFCLLVIALSFSSCEKKRTVEMHLIPVGYEGVVITVYKQEGFPALPLKDGFLVYAYPKDGILITSSPQEFGSASDRTFELLDDGTQRPLGTDGRIERFAASGSQEGGGKPSMSYSFKVIGTDSYWNSINSKEYDKKQAEAIRKLESLRNRQSEQVTPSNGDKPSN